MPRSLTPLFATLCAALGAVLLTPFHTRAAEPAKAGAPDIQYNRDIRPILAENCFACHGVDSGARKAGLRLDVREAAVDAGAIVPGKPEASDLIARIHADGEPELMPPLKSNKKLTAAQRELLKKWIAGRCRVPAALVVHPAGEGARTRR